MKKILLVLYKFPPSNDVGAFRPVKFINHLNQLGWNPIILAPSNGVYHSYDTGLEKTVADKCKIYRIPMFFPFKKSDILKSSNIKPIKHLLWRFWNRLAFPDGAIAWLFAAIWAGMKISQKQNIDLIFASGPPFSTFLGASYIKRKLKKKMIVDFRDSWTFNPFRSVSFIRRWFDEQLEKFVFRSADAIVFATDELRRFEIERLKSSKACHKCYTVTNSFERGNEQKLSHCFNKHFVVIHAGNLFHTRNPEVLFRGLSLAASLSSSFATHARFIFYGVFDSSKFEKICKNLGINSIVSFKPRIPQKQLFPLLKQASALLLINTHVPGHQIFIPAKFFDYLNAGRPIICLSKIGALSQIMSKTQSGVIVDPKNPVQIAREILKMYDQIYVIKSSFLIDQKNIAEYESLQTTKLLVDICNKVVSGCHTETS
jgi:glycosyltransferase involved in cell wall biosynthesis